MDWVLLASQKILHTVGQEILVEECKTYDFDWLFEKFVSHQIIVPTIENGKERSIRACFTFFFFLAHSDTINNIWTGLSDISY